MSILHLDACSWRVGWGVRQHADGLDDISQRPAQRARALHQGQRLHVRRRSCRYAARIMVIFNVCGRDDRAISDILTVSLKQTFVPSGDAAVWLSRGENALEISARSANLARSIPSCDSRRVSHNAPRVLRTLPLIPPSIDHQPPTPAISSTSSRRVLCIRIDFSNICTNSTFTFHAQNHISLSPADLHLAVLIAWPLWILLRPFAPPPALQCQRC